ncbi:MAG: redoxin domain-containing protein [Armatimonas sp.]
MPLRSGSDMPSLAGATEWIGEPQSREALLGSPTFIHFWSISCYICKDNLPRLKGWIDEYAPQGVKFVAVHMPREEVETDIEKVKAAIAEFGIPGPCAVDNQHTLTQAFGNDQAWVPYYFLFDAEGKLKSRGAGNAAADTLEGALKRLVTE